MSSVLATLLPAPLQVGWGLGRALSIYYGQPWRTLSMRRFYAALVKPGALCFDLGANVGNRTRCWLGLGARVVAVEPQPAPLWVLRWLYGRSPRATLVPEAVSDHPGTTTLLINRLNTTITTVSATWAAQFTEKGLTRHPFDQQLQVPTCTLDQLIAKHGVPDFCKIDVEGHELAVLRGLSVALPALSFEAFPLGQGAARDCVERLETLGRYRYRRVRAETFRWVEPDWLDADAMLENLDAMVLRDGSMDVYALRSEDGS